MYNLENEKKELCQEIGHFFGCYFEENGQLCIDNGDEVFRYNTPDELLADWVETLIQSHIAAEGFGNDWEKEILFIYTNCIKKHPAGIRKVDGKGGTTWHVSYDIPNPNYPHYKNAYLGSYSSLIEAILARRLYLEEDISGIDTNTDEGLKIAVEKAAARRLKAKENKQAKRQSKSFAVIFTYSFDGEVAVYAFSTENEAKQFLKENFEEEVRIDAEENDVDTESVISEDGWSAKIINHFADHDNVTEMRIGRIYQ